MNKKAISIITCTCILVGGYFSTTPASSHKDEIKIIQPHMISKTEVRPTYQTAIKKIEVKEIKKEPTVQPQTTSTKKETVKTPVKQEPKVPVKEVKEEPKAPVEEVKKEEPKQEVQETSSVSQAQLNHLNNQAIAHINSIRSQALAMNGTLNSYAAIRAKEASVQWSHTRPNGTRGINMIDASKYRGENLAKTVLYDFDGSDAMLNEVASRLFNNWKNSSSHYNNMVYGEFTQIGLKTYVVVEGNKYIFYTAAMFSN